LSIGFFGRAPSYPSAAITPQAQGYTQRRALLLNRTRRITRRALRTSPDARRAEGASCHRDDQGVESTMLTHTASTHAQSRNGKEIGRRERGKGEGGRERRKEAGEEGKWGAGHCMTRSMVCSAQKGTTALSRSVARARAHLAITRREPQRARRVAEPPGLYLDGLCGGCRVR
jgi:hypothetical protein